MKLPVIKTPNEILRKESMEVDRNFVLSDKGRKFIKDMIETMYTDDGIGLAAPQVGKNLRICVIGKEATGDEKDLILINPVWEKISRRTFIDTEGCLSVPKTFGKVRRYKNIVVTAMNEKGKYVEFEAHKFLARVIQHESDHLDGVLFIDKAKGIYEIE